jgi:hypothetical protein
MKVREAPLMVVEESEDGEAWVKDHELNPILARPNADYGIRRLTETTEIFLCTTGSALWVNDEHGVQLDMDDLARAWNRVPGSGEYVIRADSSRPETINEMRKRGFRCEAAPKWDGSVKDGVEHLRSYEQIVIHPRCKLATQEARLWRYKTDARTGDVVPKLEDGHEHVWDSVRYALSPLIRHTNRPRFSTAVPTGAK